MATVDREPTFLGRRTSVRGRSRRRLGFRWRYLASVALPWAVAIWSSAVVVPDAPFTGTSRAAGLALLAAIVIAVVATTVALVRRRWISAAVIVAASVALHVSASCLADQQDIDSPTELLQAESNVHDELVELSQAFEARGEEAVGILPEELRALSRDNVIHVIADGTTLYISVWENWRGESGTGFMYTHDPTRTIPIGPGYGVTPSVDLGDGWWYSGGS